MKKNRKNEEGAVLLLLIIMMSAVVLIVASLLRFNTQNIRFAAIESEQEKALYLAEGIADSIDFYLLAELPLFKDDEGNPYNNVTDINQLLNKCSDSPNLAHMQWINNIEPEGGGSDDQYFQLPSTESYLGKTSINEIAISVYGDQEDGSYHVTEADGWFSVVVKIEVSGDNARRLIAITLEIPPASELENVSTLIESINLNYSNSL